MLVPMQGEHEQARGVPIDTLKGDFDYNSRMAYKGKQHTMSRPVVTCLESWRKGSR